MYGVNIVFSLINLNHANFSVFLLFRMRNYKKKDKSYTPEDLASAIKDVIENGMSVRETAVSYQIPRITLQDNVAKFKKGVKEPAKHHLAVFTKSQENMLALYLELAVKCFHGLTSNETRKCAFVYAKAYGIQVPSSWESSKMGGADWLYSFMKRNELSIRKPQATSISRGTTSNSRKVGDFIMGICRI